MLIETDGVGRWCTQDGRPGDLIHGTAMNAPEVIALAGSVTRSARQTFSPLGGCGVIGTGGTVDRGRSIPICMSPLQAHTALIEGRRNLGSTARRPTRAAPHRWHAEPAQVRMRHALESTVLERLLRWSASAGTTLGHPFSRMGRGLAAVLLLVAAPSLASAASQPAVTLRGTLIAVHGDDFAYGRQTRARRVGISDLSDAHFNNAHFDAHTPSTGQAQQAGVAGLRSRGGDHLAAPARSRRSGHRGAGRRPGRGFPWLEGDAARP